MKQPLFLQKSSLALFIWIPPLVLLKNIKLSDCNFEWGFDNSIIKNNENIFHMKNEIKHTAHLKYRYQYHRYLYQNIKNSMHKEGKLDIGQSISKLWEEKMEK